uniref:Wall-associated protein kinase-like n=1 Tax=Oryza sativa subsp. japonica TaxID=39947 RepID=Q6ZDV1_ORYSJ|nr:wall-associated protein kinase-like [Oryza sativa Japonica Group]
MKKQTTNTVIVFPSRNKKQKRKEDGRRFSGDQTAARVRLKFALNDCQQHRNTYPLLVPE